MADIRNQCEACGASLVSNKARTCGASRCKRKLASGEPFAVIGIWDNGGETADRYTVALDPKAYPANPGRVLMLGMSGAPSHPQGVSQFSEGMVGRHLGKRISWADLPVHIRAHVAARLKEE